MSRARQTLLVVVIALLAGGAGYGFNLWRVSGTAQDGAAKAVMGAKLVDLQGQSQALAQWRGKVMVVNFWATWCEPCREEIPMFVRMQEKYLAQGLQFVGIAIDQADKVRSFGSEFKVNYPLLLGTVDTVELSRQAGNRVGALPFTLVLDRGGKIVATQLGEIKEAKLEGIVSPLLKASSN
jgi:thiol-disulfide isomerase/thioredoxin